MRLRAALTGGLFAAQLCLSAAFCLAVTGFSSGIPSSQITPTATIESTAYVTQSGYGVNAREYDTTFGENWDSVRTFRLLTPLDKPIKVYINEHASQESLYRPQYKKYVLESLRAWNSALDGRLTYTLATRAKDADITVDWVPSFSDRYIAGITNYSVGHADMQIKTIGVPDKDIKCNIMHEFGHALGIAGHSDNPDDIMVGVRRWHRDNLPYNPTLSKRDIQAIRRLYSASWHKGEDLYTANAQNTPIFYSPIAAGASSVPSQPTFKTESTAVAEPLGNSAVINWTVTPQPQKSNSSMSSAPTAPKKFKYTQIFPGH
jgi:predicted Zn-dependent protease